MAEGAFPDIFQEDYVKNNDKSQTELNRVQKEGELAGTVAHMYFKGGWDANKKQNTELDRCPASVEKKGKPKKEGGPPSQYKVPLQMVARLEHLTTIPGVCELTEDGRFKVLAKVEYMKSSERGEPLFTDWAMSNYKALYDEHDQTFDERTRSQLKNYIAPTGEIATETFIRLTPNSDITLKCKDEGASSIFRAKLDHTSLPKVRRHTKLNLTNISVVAWIYMKAETIVDGETSKEVYVPRTTYWLKPGKVALAPGEEHYKSIAAKLRENETPDRHSMAPPPLVVTNRVQVPASTYFLVRNRYSTPVTGNPEQLGISLVIEPAKKPEDVLYTDQELNRVKLTNKNLTVYQWKGSPVDGHQKYLVQLKGPRDNGKLAEKYGIIDTDTYGLIMFAHNDVTHHAICSLWWSATFRNTPGNSEEALRHDNTGTSGYYKYGYDDLIPDYYLYFEEDRGALQISRELCAELFEEFLGTIKRTGATQLTLRSAEAVNPVNADGVQSEVLLLGRPDYQVFNGDAWPAISNGRIYVMTSHVLSADERSIMCGRNADTAAADKRFKELLQIPGFTYMVFVVQGTQSNDESDTPATRKAPAKKKATPEPEPMDIEDDDVITSKAEPAAAEEEEIEFSEEADDEIAFSEEEEKEEEEEEVVPVKRSAKPMKKTVTKRSKKE